MYLKNIRNNLTSKNKTQRALALYEFIDMLMDYKVKGLVRANKPNIILVPNNASEGINDILNMLGYKSIISDTLDEAINNTSIPFPENQGAVYILTKESKSKENSLLEPELVPYIRVIPVKEAKELLLNEELNVLVTDIDTDELVEYYDLFVSSSPVASIIDFITG